MATLYCALTLLVLFSASAPSASQFVSPYPISDCSSGIGFGYSSCPSQEGCCFGASVCCAGGCCPITAWCVNQGQSNEGCCELDDPDSCGASIASFSKPPCTATRGLDSKPSVQCVSADDDWYCPPGAVCGTTYPLCHDFFELGCESEIPATTASPVPTTGPTGSAGAEDEGTTASLTGSGPQNVATTSAAPFGGASVVEKPGIGLLGALAVVLGLVI